MKPRYKLVNGVPVVVGMKKQDAVSYFGSQAALARALGIGKASVGQWRDVPLDRQCQIEIITDGKLKADRHLLFPRSSHPVADTNVFGPTPREAA